MDKKSHIYSELDFHLITDMKEFENFEHGHLIGIKNEAEKQFFPASMFEFCGFHWHNASEQTLPCLLQLSDLEYATEDLIMSSRIYLDNGRLNDFRQNHIKLYAENSPNSVRFIID